MLQYKIKIWHLSVATASLWECNRSRSTVIDEMKQKGSMFLAAKSGGGNAGVVLVTAHRSFFTGSGIASRTDGDQFLSGQAPEMDLRGALDVGDTEDDSDLMHGGGGGGQGLRLDLNAIRSAVMMPGDCGVDTALASFLEEDAADAPSPTHCTTHSSVSPDAAEALAEAQQAAFAAIAARYHPAVYALLLFPCEDLFRWFVFAGLLDTYLEIERCSTTSTRMGGSGNEIDDRRAGEKIFLKKKEARNDAMESARMRILRVRMARNQISSSTVSTTHQGKNKDPSSSSRSLPSSSTSRHLRRHQPLHSSVYGSPVGRTLAKWLPGPVALVHRMNAMMAVRLDPEDLATIQGGRGGGGEREEGGERAVVQPTSLQQQTDPRHDKDENKENTKKKGRKGKKNVPSDDVPNNNSAAAAAPTAASAASAEATTAVVESAMKVVTVVEDDIEEEDMDRAQLRHQQRAFFLETSTAASVVDLHNTFFGHANEAANAPSATHTPENQRTTTTDHASSKKHAATDDREHADGKTFSFFASYSSSQHAHLGPPPPVTPAPVLSSTPSPVAEIAHVPLPLVFAFGDVRSVLVDRMLQRRLASFDAVTEAHIAAHLERQSQQRKTRGGGWSSPSSSSYLSCLEKNRAATEKEKEEKVSLPRSDASSITLQQSSMLGLDLSRMQPLFTAPLLGLSPIHTALVRWGLPHRRTWAAFLRAAAAVVPFDDSLNHHSNNTENQNQFSDENAAASPHTEEDDSASTSSVFSSAIQGLIAGTVNASTTGGSSGSGSGGHSLLLMPSDVLSLFRPEHDRAGPMVRCVVLSDLLLAAAEEFGAVALAAVAQQLHQCCSSTATTTSTPTTQPNHHSDQQLTAPDIHVNVLCVPSPSSPSLSFSSSSSQQPPAPFLPVRPVGYARALTRVLHHDTRRRLDWALRGSSQRLADAASGWVQSLDARLVMQQEEEQQHEQEQHGETTRTDEDARSSPLMDEAEEIGKKKKHLLTHVKHRRRKRLLVMLKRMPRHIVRQLLKNNSNNKNEKNKKMQTILEKYDNDRSSMTANEYHSEEQYHLPSTKDHADGNARGGHRQEAEADDGHGAVGIVSKKKAANSTQPSTKTALQLHRCPLSRFRSPTTTSSTALATTTATTNIATTTSALEKEAATITPENVKSVKTPPPPPPHVDPPSTTPLVNLELEGHPKEGIPSTEAKGHLHSFTKRRRRASYRTTNDNASASSSVLEYYHHRVNHHHHGVDEYNDDADTASLSSVAAGQLAHKATLFPIIPTQAISATEEEEREVSSSSHSSTDYHVDYHSSVSLNLNGRERNDNGDEENTINKEWKISNKKRSSVATIRSSVDAFCATFKPSPRADLQTSPLTTLSAAEDQMSGFGVRRCPSDTALLAPRYHTNASDDTMAPCTPPSATTMTTSGQPSSTVVTTGAENTSNTSIFNMSNTISSNRRLHNGVAADYFVPLAYRYGNAAARLQAVQQQRPVQEEHNDEHHPRDGILKEENGAKALQHTQAATTLRTLRTTSAAEVEDSMSAAKKPHQQQQQQQPSAADQLQSLFGCASGGIF